MMASAMVPAPCHLVEDCDEDILVEVTRHLPLMATYHLATTCKALRSHIRAARDLWRERCINLVKQSVCVCSRLFEFDAW